jgi:hypothetical protein
MTPFSRWFLGVLALACLGWLWGSLGERQADAVSTEVLVPGGGRAASGGQIETANKVAGGKRRALDGERRAARELEALAGGDGRTLAAPLEEGRAVRVVSALDGSVMASARVTWLGLSEVGSWKHFVPGDFLGSYMRWEDPEAELLADGASFVADENGCLFLPAEDGLVMGRRGELFLMRELCDGGTEPIVLALSTDTSVDVRVLGAGGGPVAGVDIWLVQDFGAWVEAGYLGTSPVEGGAVRCAHLGARLRAERDGLVETLDPDAALSIVAGVLAREPVAASIDLDHPPSSRIDLVMPQVGSVVVRGPSVGGVPVEEDVSLAIKGVRGLHKGLYEECEVASGPLLDGVASFENIELGMELVAGVYGSPSTLVFTGPRRPGEVVSISLESTAPRFLFTIRVLGERGEPLPEGMRFELSMGVTSEQGTLYEDERWVTLGPDGNLQVPVFDWPRAAAGHRGWISLVSIGAEPKWEGGRSLPGVLVSGLNRVGDLRISREPLLAEGVVLDGRGLGVAGVWVRAVGISGSGESTWDVEELAAGRSGARGEFWLYGGATQEMSLRCVSDDYEWDRIDSFAPGAKGLELHMWDVGGLRGSVELPSGFSPERLDVWAAREAPAVRPEAARAWSQSVLRDGSFEFPWLPAGSYRVLVFSADQNGSLHDVHGVQVRLGETTEDPRLQGLSAGEFEAWDLEFVDSKGDPIPEGYVAWAESGNLGGSDDFGSWFHSGDCRLNVPFPAIDIEVESPAFWPLRRSGVAGSTTLEMTRLPQVRLVLDGAGLPDLGALRFDLVWLGDESEEDVDASAFDEAIGAELEQVWYVEPPGLWGVDVRYVLGKEPSIELMDAPLPIAVKDLTGEQTIRIYVDPARIIEAQVQLDVGSALLGD